MRSMTVAVRLAVLAMTLTAAAAPVPTEPVAGMPPEFVGPASAARSRTSTAPTKRKPRP